MQSPSLPLSMLVSNNINNNAAPSSSEDTDFCCILLSTIKKMISILTHILSLFQKNQTSNSKNSASINDNNNCQNLSNGRDYLSSFDAAQCQALRSSDQEISLLNDEEENQPPQISLGSESNEQPMSSQTLVSATQNTLIQEISDEEWTMDDIDKMEQAHELQQNKVSFNIITDAEQFTQAEQSCHQWYFNFKFNNSNTSTTIELDNSDANPMTQTQNMHTHQSLFWKAILPSEDNMKNMTT